jgi:predicted CXXCH cytochrome family protein
MKGLKLSLIVMTATLLTIGLSGMAFAFHSGGVAECGGCHSMHSPAAGGSKLLIRVDQSSTCLSCHAAADTTASSYHVMTYPVPGAGSAPVERTPGGDFAWLLKDYTMTIRNATTTEKGETHGHNVYAADFGIGGDSRFSTSPGGSFPAGPQFQCTSCHDAHGKYRRLVDGTVVTSGKAIRGSGSYKTSADPDANFAVGTYRLLPGLGFTQGGTLVGFPGVPNAVVTSTYNMGEGTNQLRVAYGIGSKAGTANWGKWCGACHGNMHSDGNYVHPVDQNLGPVQGIYNAYLNSSNTTGNTSATSYLSLVPFVDNTDNYTTLKGLANNNSPTYAGPATANEKVSCLSCHRAHATGWPEALRWNMEGEFLTVADTAGNAIWPGTDNGAPAQFARGRTAAETKAAYYDRNVSVFGAYQRVLCNKCHAKD